jgi:riboflavin kinase/FMN adenylyltransferase
MQIIRHPENLSPEWQGTVVALGNFDGFHRGHQTVVGEAGRVARATGQKLAVLATEPHPRSFFQPDAATFRLTSFRERAELLAAFGVDLHFALTFDNTLAATSPENFAKRYLAEGLKAGCVVVGYDYRFGVNRSGEVDTLRELGRQLGFDVRVVDPVTFGVEGAAGEIYSSSRIREALRSGEARLAAALLGHWWGVSGHVLRGDRRGHTIGFPTANLEFHDSIVPRHGVYAVRVRIGEDQAQTLDGIANVGVRPTFGGNGELLEVHLFDFDQNLYDRLVRAEFVGFLRAERKFTNAGELKAQIQRDIAACRTMLADPENSRDHLTVPTLDNYLKSHEV